MTAVDQNVTDVLRRPELQRAPLGIGVEIDHLGPQADGIEQGHALVDSLAADRHQTDRMPYRIGRTRAMPIELQTSRRHRQNGCCLPLDCRIKALSVAIVIRRDDDAAGDRGAARQAHHHLDRTKR